MSIKPCACLNCKHFLPDVTNERDEYEPFGWCRRGAPGLWLSDEDFKWKNASGTCVLAVACCGDHEDKPCKPPSQSSD